MLPTLPPGKVIIATSFFYKIIPGNIYVFKHDGLEKIKRAVRVEGSSVYFLGDNLDHSTDSRHFGWISQDKIIAKQLKPRLQYAGTGWLRKQLTRR